jgi:hypothetical protein
VTGDHRRHVAVAADGPGSASSRADLEGLRLEREHLAGQVGEFKLGTECG